MSESKTSWFLKTMGLVILAAVVTSLLTTWLQYLLWDTSSPGVSGGAAAGVAVAVAMSRRHSLPQEPPKA
jgi:hypothetical protein